MAQLSEGSGPGLYKKAVRKKKNRREQASR